LPLDKQPEVVSLFSGCGGSSLGYKLAGFKILSANEFVNAARDTYHANFPDTILISEDVRKINGEQILKLIKKKKGELDVLDGSPPCNAFTTTGKREKNWGINKHYSDEKFQRTDDLYYEFIRILKDIMPKVFLTENVPALTQGVARGYFNDIFTKMKETGYNVRCAIMDASLYNVAQKRKRLFFMGVRKDFNVQPSFPRPNKRPLTVREVWNNLKNNKWELEQARDVPFSVKTWLKQIKAGQKGSQVHPKKFFFSLTRVAMDRPSPTVVGISGDSAAGGKWAALCHHSENRYLTISEIKRISSFPDDFILTGNFAQQWERVARAVPPNLMKANALHIKENILPLLK
jgi:DNA (cytosine-5)-methyltransferase 1